MKEKEKIERVEIPPEDIFTILNTKEKFKRFLGLRVKEKRKEKGLTVKELAEKIGENEDAIKTFESKGMGNFYLFFKILDALGVSCDEILMKEKSLPENYIKVENPLEKEYLLMQKEIFPEIYKKEGDYIGTYKKLADTSAKLINYPAILALFAEIYSPEHLTELNKIAKGIVKKLAFEKMYKEYGEKRKKSKKN